MAPRTVSIMYWPANNGIRPAWRGFFSIAMKGHRSAYASGSPGAAIEGPEATRLQHLGHCGHAETWCGTNGSPLGATWKGELTASL